ncbi:unnamed protein product [Ceratitis capitata]|uniref:(Mediterranean fruit fly) hypothetical protein n=1 Tax=Ceratitis capitata TaxID=7213 RepID=A0A811VAJ6_CERCA|nr:unnamed protein product [Ceratitis capitata]
MSAVEKKPTKRNAGQMLARPLMNASETTNNINKQQKIGNSTLPLTHSGWQLTPPALRDNSCGCGCSSASALLVTYIQKQHEVTVIPARAPAIATTTAIVAAAEVADCGGE